MSDRTAVVLDASALLALLGKEPGAERVEPFVLQGNAVVSAVNASEVIAKHAERGMPAERTMSFLHLLGLQLHTFDSEDGVLTGSLRTATKQLGLSFGDRACLALAMKLKLPAVTADQAWSKLDLPVEIVQIRP
jgi:PIN domain nuclease of toxin-antitoxin system